MKTQPKHGDLQPRKQFFTAEESLWQKQSPEDFFIALYVFLTTPKQKVYRVSKKDPTKTGWKVCKDSTTLNWVFDPAEGADLKTLPAVHQYMELNVRNNRGCHIIASSDFAITLYIQEDGHVAAMLATTESI